MIRAADLGLIVKGGSGDEVHVLCPFHDDSRPSASFNQAKGLFYCHACGTGMTVETLAKRLKVDVSEIGPIELIPGSFSIELIKKETEIDFGFPIDEEVFTYLDSRKITRDSARAYFRKRITPQVGALITLKNHKDIIIGTTSRIFPPNDTKVKYLVSGDKPCLWPFQEFEYEYNTLIFVEGIFSRIRLVQVLEECDYAEDYSVGVFSLLGARVNKDLAPILAQTDAKNVIFLFDNDNAGHQAIATANQMFPLARALAVNHEIDRLPDNKLKRLIEKFNT